MEEIVEELPEEEPKKKWLAILAAIFLLSIVVVYFLPGDVFSVLQGRLESSKLDGFEAEYDGGKVIFDKAVYEMLREIYINNQKTETKVCLTGEKVGDDYYINGIEIPEIFSATVYQVISEGCGDALIPMHTHPFRHCLFSEQDIKSYESLSNKDAMIGLMCEIDRFSFYSAS
jgi:hypothetical protein